MNAFGEGIVTIVLAIVGLGIISALVSRKANTAGVVQAFASGIGNDIGVAQSPVTGQSVPLNLSYPSSNGYLSGFGG